MPYASLEKIVRATRVRATRVRATLFRATLILAALISVASPLAAQDPVVSTASVSLDSPAVLYSRIGVSAANEAGLPTNPDCSLDPVPIECANNEVETRTAMVRRVTTSVPTRRVDLVLSKLSDGDPVVAGGSVTYTITAENLPQANLDRFFYSEEPNVFEIDPVDGTILNVFPSPVFFSEEGGEGMANTESTLLIGASRLRSIFELDPDTGATLREIPNPGISIAGLAYRDGEIFAVTDDPFPAVGRVMVLDYETGEVRRVLGSFSPDQRQLYGSLAAAPTQLLSVPFVQDFTELLDLDPIDQRALYPALYPLDGLELASGLGSFGDELFFAEDVGFRIYPFGSSSQSRVFPIDAQPQGVAGDQFQTRQDVVGATVTDAFPPELSCTWTCAATGGATCTAGPVAGDINDGVDIPVGESVTYTAVCAVSSSATGTLTNTASIDGPTNTFELDDSNNAATVVNSLSALSDLAITKTDDRDPVVAGQSLTYSVTVDNVGPSDATSVVVTEALPAEVTLIATTGCANDPLGAPSCDLGTIPAGSSASFDIEVFVDPGATNSLFNSVSVTSASDDLVPSNNDTVEETRVVASPIEIPALGGLGLAFLLALLGACGMLLSRRSL